MVEGVGRKRRDCSGDVVRVVQHFGRRNMKYPVSIFSQERVAPFVAKGTVSAGMRLAVNLHHKAGFAAEEIDDVATQRMLPSKPGAAPVPTQPLPKQYLRKAHLAA